MLAYPRIGSYYSRMLPHTRYMKYEMSIRCSARQRILRDGNGRLTVKKSVKALSQLSTSPQGKTTNMGESTGYDSSLIYIQDNWYAERGLHISDESHRELRTEYIHEVFSETSGCCHRSFAHRKMARLPTPVSRFWPAR